MLLAAGCWLLAAGFVPIPYPSVLCIGGIIVPKMLFYNEIGRFFLMTFCSGADIDADIDAANNGLNYHESTLAQSFRLVTYQNLG